jgi:pyruvate,orthophosphate dikinase
MGVSQEKLERRAAELHESNPMLGFRGCRLAIAFPEIAQMQARAIFEGALEAKRKTGALPAIEIMVPLVVTKPEFDLVKAEIDATARAVMAERGEEIRYSVGTMIELPRACLAAAKIAETAEFFSFGTNDLTQTALGISRDDAGSFLGLYEQRHLLPKDPFVSIDREGVGELVEIAVTRGRQARPDIKLGICGEHGGDPASIGFFETIGLTYISCSPFRVPIARLAAAQAALGKVLGENES